MKNFCFGLVGFCVVCAILTFALHNLIVCLIFVIVAAAAFVVGSLSKGTRSMKSSTGLPFQAPSPNHCQPGDQPDVLPPAVTQQTVMVPDIFDADRIRQDLATFAHQPGIFGKYVERARSRFNKAGERALLNQWITYHETGRRLIESRTEMEKCRSQWLQLSNGHALSGKQKDAEISKLEADMEEHALRRDAASYKRGRLDRFVEGGNPVPVEPKEPKITPEQQRRLRRMEIEDKMRELDQLETAALKNARNETDRKQIENMYANNREQLREKLSDNLI